MASTLNALGELHYRKNDPRGAVPYFEQALEIRRKRLGPRDPIVAQSLFNIGMALEKSGDGRGAEARFREALAIWLERLGPDHPSVKAVRNEIAGLEAKSSK